jgi:hypothetical protein
MARWRWLLSAALAASAISSVATVQAEEEGNENERPVSIDEIPAPARDAILRQVGTGILTEVLEETGPGREPVYEGHIDQGKRKGVVRVDAAGNILEIHRVV